ncbi:DUF4145 domain-containing protein [Cupriavidus basilensis]
MTTKPRSSREEPVWSHCNECGHETQHNVVQLIRKSRDYDHDRHTVSVGTNWRVLQCCGCHEVAMSRVDWCSEDDPHDPYVPIYFPPRVSRRKPDWLVRQEVPAYQGLLDEVYAALHADSRRLAMMGARAIIDKAIARKIGNQGNFVKGLDELQRANLLSHQERPIIEAAFDAGSAAMHRGHQPSVDSLNTAIDIVERIIHAEILEEKAKELAAVTPKRPPRSATTKAKKQD